MKTEDGDEIIDPGDYDLGDNTTLHVFFTGNDEVGYKLWACAAYDHGPFCRLCKEVDGMLNALLINVIDGRMTLRQDQDGEFQFRMTAAGNDAVRSMIKRVDEDPS
jgi:hypothetical protein